MKNFFFIGVSFAFLVFFTSCYSVNESKNFGFLALGDAMLDMEYHYSLAGFQKDFNFQHHNTNHLSYLIGNSTRDLSSDFSDYFKTLKPFTLSAVGNFSYNLIYILHLPSKIIHSIHYDATKEGSNFFIVIWSVVKNIVYGLWGAIQALIMLFVGTIIGFFAHPINTFTDLFYLTIPTLKAIWFAIKYIFIGY